MMSEIKERQLVHYLMKVMWRLPKAFSVRISPIFWHHLKEFWEALAVYKPLRRRERRGKKAGDELHRVMEKYGIQKLTGIDDEE